MQTLKPKIAIIGTGHVGSTFAFALMISGIAREIVLIGREREKAQGEAMDLSHGASFVPPVQIRTGGYEECRNTDVVVITAGVGQKPGETRLDLTRRNVEIFKTIVPQIREHTDSAVLLVVSNPMDILTYVTLKLTGFPPNQVLGSGTVLDSSRLRFLMSRHCQVDPRYVHAYIIGEHGDTELPVWSNANIAGMVLAQYCPVCEQGCDHENELKGIFEEVKNAAYQIIQAKGATYYAIALALVRIVQAILRDENSVLPVSTLVQDYYGIGDVCIGTPCVINRQGVKKFIKLELSFEEQQQFRHSAKTLRTLLDRIKL